MLDKVIHNGTIIDFKASKIYDSIFNRLEKLNLHSTSENEQLSFDIQDIVLDDLQDVFEYSAGYPSTKKIKELIQTAFKEFKEN